MRILDKNINRGGVSRKKGEGAESLRNIALTQHNEEQVSEVGVDYDRGN
jgi:hypothetical protein